MAFLNTLKPWLMRTLGSSCFTELMMPEAITIPLLPGMPAPHCPEGLLVVSRISSGPTPAEPSIDGPVHALPLWPPPERTAGPSEQGLSVSFKRIFQISQHSNRPQAQLSPSCRSLSSPQLVCPRWMDLATLTHTPPSGCGQGSSTAPRWFLGVHLRYGMTKRSRCWSERSIIRSVRGQNLGLVRPGDSVE